MVVALPTGASSRGQALPCETPRSSGTSHPPTGTFANLLAGPACVDRHPVGAIASAFASTEAADRPTSHRPSSGGRGDALGGTHRFVLARVARALWPLVHRGQPLPTLVQAGDMDTNRTRLARARGSHLFIRLSFVTVTVILDHVAELA